MFATIALLFVALSFLVSLLVVFACVRSAQLSQQQGMPATETFAAYSEKQPLFNNQLT